MKIERNRQLAKDIAIYGIGNIGNKFLVFLLYPVLSFFLERNELGYYDISLEAVLFLLPVVTLQMRESTFRLLIDNNDASYRKHILSTTFFIEGILFALVLVAASLLPFFFSIRYLPLIVLSIYVYSLYEIYLQAVRAVYTSTQYMLISFISSFLTVASTFLIYFVFRKGIEALFIGNIIARLSAMIIIELPRRQIVSSLSVRFFKRAFVSEIFRYTIPMMWSALAFGIITSSGKYIATYFLSADANGILALAQKYMSPIMILGLTFNQAWQVTAVKIYREPRSEQFFSEVFNKFTFVVCLLVVGISFGLRSFKSILLGENFYQSADIIYVYCFSAVFFCLSFFMEIIYQCTKQTNKILYSSVTCAILSVPLSIVLTKNFGLTGMIAGLSFSYFYLFAFRYFQTKKIMPIRFKLDFFLSIVVLVAGGIIFYSSHNKIVDYAVLTITTLLMLYYFYALSKFVRKR